MYCWTIRRANKSGTSVRSTLLRVVRRGGSDPRNGRQPTSDALVPPVTDLMRGSLSFKISITSSTCSSSLSDPKARDVSLMQAAAASRLSHRQRRPRCSTKVAHPGFQSSLFPPVKADPLKVHPVSPDYPPAFLAKLGPHLPV